jgi:hypothetical protein
MKKLLMLAALIEGGTGVILLAYPTIVVQLLFGSENRGLRGRRNRAPEKHTQRNASC